MINKLNPLYLITFLIILSLASFFYIHEKQYEFKKSVETLYEMKKLVKEYKELKYNWDDKINTQNSIEKLLNDTNYKSASIRKNQRGKTIEIQIESDNPDILVHFLSKILNMKIFINKLEIKSTSINIEIGI